MSRRFFSEYPADEQRQGIDLAARLASYHERKKQAEDSAVKATHRLSAKPWFDECERGLAEDELAVVHRVHEGYLQVHRAALAGAQGRLSALGGEWTTLAAELQDHNEVVHAVTCFKNDHQIVPEVDPDLPAPDKLAEGIYAYEELVRAELEQTRILLEAHRPDLLKQYKYNRSKQTVDFGGAGQAVADAADDLLAARIALRELRNEAQPPPPAEPATQSA